jgi:hypothetical protein
MNIQLEEYLSELTQLQNERMVNEHGLRSEILRPYISEETGPMLHFVTDIGSQYNIEDVIGNESSFLSLLNGNVTIKPRIYNFAIATINKTVANMLKEEYQERYAFIQKNKWRDFSFRGNYQEN